MARNVPRLPDGEIDFSELRDIQPLAAGHFAKIYRANYCGTPVAAKMLLDVDCNFMKKYIDRELAILRFGLAEVRLSDTLLCVGKCDTPTLCSSWACVATPLGCT
jgi:hypothetical protein